MSNKTRNILITVAVVLIVLAAAGIAAALLMGRSSAGEAENSTSADTTHAAEEYMYNSDGSVSSIMYYDNNKYNGRKDYYTDTKTRTDYVMTYDAEGTETVSEKTEHNAVGSMTFYQKREMGVIVQTVEYDYYDDMKTLKKKTTKDFDAEGAETAEKLYYFENGKVSQRCEYTNGELTLQQFYDEDGNTVAAPDGTVAD